MCAVQRPLFFLTAPRLPWYSIAVGVRCANTGISDYRAMFYSISILLPKPAPGFFKVVDKHTRKAVRLKDHQSRRCLGRGSRCKPQVTAVTRGWTSKVLYIYIYANLLWSIRAFINFRLFRPWSGCAKKIAERMFPVKLWARAKRRTLYAYISYVRWKLPTAVIVLNINWMIYQ